MLDDGLRLLLRLQRIGPGEVGFGLVTLLLVPTHDPQDGGNYDLADAIRLRAGAHSLEAKAFNVVASGFLDQAMLESLSDLHPDAARILEGSPRSVSLVTGPSGQIVSDVISDEEGMLYADIDIAQCVAPKQIHDISGGYNRFDIFQLTVDRSANRPVTFVSDQAATPSTDHDQPPGPGSSQADLEPRE